MATIRMPLKTLAGLSFSLAEHILAGACSQANSLRTVIRLDHGSDTEEFEEVLAFYCHRSQCRWIMWRDTNTVFLQRPLGSVHQYGSVSEALEALETGPPAVLTDIVADTWPV
jgi:hypothetical protein